MGLRMEGEVIYERMDLGCEEIGYSKKITFLIINFLIQIKHFIGGMLIY